MKKLEIIGLLIMGLLFFVWPIAHTATLRDLLLVLNLALFGYLAWQKGWPGKVLWELSLPAAILLAFTLWMYVVAVFISAETAWSLDEIQSQWWRALVALLIGVFVACAAKDNSRFSRKVWFVLLAVLLLHIFIVDWLGVREWRLSEELERSAGLTGGPDMSSYLTNILFGLLLAEVFYRAVHKMRMLPFSNVVLAGALGLTVISVFAELTRNAIITLVFMLLALSVLYQLIQRGRLKTSTHIALVAAMLLVVLGGVGLISIARESSGLDNLIDTAPIAWDTEHYKAWQDGERYGWPKLPDGETVDISSYLRIAWFKEGLLLVRDHPLGIGYGRSAFGHGIKAKYDVKLGHSHSGLLDIMIGIGIPGALLWVAFVVSLVYLAYRRLHLHAPNYAAVLLFLVVLDYGIRMLLDSIQRDHIMQQFIFLVGLAAVTMVCDAKVRNPRKNKFK